MFLGRDQLLQIHDQSIVTGTITGSIKKWSAAFVGALEVDDRKGVGVVTPLFVSPS
jgi:hypothetical protein